MPTPRCAPRKPRPSARRARRLRPGLRRFFLRLWGLLLFALAAIGTSAAFAWPRGVQELVIAATLFVLVLRFAWVVVALVLAPGQPRLRLVPVANGRAGGSRRLRWRWSSCFAVGRFVPELIERLTGAAAAAGALRFAGVTLACALLLATAFAFFGRRSRAPRFPRSFVLALLVVVAYAVWLLSPMWGTIAAIAAAVIALQIGLRELVFFFWREPDGTMQDRVLPSIVLSAARFAVVLAGLALGALVLEAPLASLAAAESPLVRLSLRLVGVATLGAADPRGLDHGAHRDRPAPEPRAAARRASWPGRERAAAHAAAAAARHRRRAAAGDAGALVAVGPGPRDHAGARRRRRGGPRARLRRPGAGARRHRRRFLPRRGRVPHRRVHRERHQHQGHGRAHHAAHRGAAPPQRPAALRALRRARHGAQYLARLGGGEIQPAAADRRRQREDPQADQEGRRGDGRRPGARAADPRAAQGQALPRRPRREDLPLQVPHRARASSSTCARRPTSASRPRSPSSASASPMASRRS